MRLGRFDLPRYLLSASILHRREACDFGTNESSHCFRFVLRFHDVMIYAYILESLLVTN